MALPPRLSRLLAAPAPVALILASAVAVPAATYVVSRRPALPDHTIRVGVSTYPASVTAIWRDRQGAAHTLDPWANRPVRVAARQVVLAATADGPVQCTLEVDGVTVDTDNADPGHVAVCSWS